MEITHDLPGGGKWNPMDEARNSAGPDDKIAAKPIRCGYIHTAEGIFAKISPADESSRHVIISSAPLIVGIVN